MRVNYEIRWFRDIADRCRARCTAGPSERAPERTVAANRNVWRGPRIIHTAARDFRRNIKNISRALGIMRGRAMEKRKRIAIVQMPRARTQVRSGAVIVNVALGRANNCRHIAREVPNTGTAAHFRNIASAGSLRFRCAARAVSHRARTSVCRRASINSRWRSVARD
ncbi:MAG: hypothetical protein M0R66_00345 [Candidatus Omnitrophica bacterium]|nr:hypothetical protein [Candidatus Omnitrophota bacterium]